jgi:RNA polymerase sigma factor (TIGR02999 family)
MHEVSLLLSEWANGDVKAADRLTPLVYAELHRLASAYLRRERPDHTLQTTDLVHEAYLRLLDQQHRANFQSRVHFFGIAARLMRQILVDHARRHKATKRAGHKVSLEETVTLVRERSGDLVALDDALSALEKLDARKSKAVELRYFAGLSMEETARALDISTVTVRRDLRLAESWLNREMQRGQSAP